MSKHEDKLGQKSPAKHEINGALDDKDLEKVTGGKDKLKLLDMSSQTSSTVVKSNVR